MKYCLHQFSVDIAESLILDHVQRDEVYLACCPGALSEVGWPCFFSPAERLLVDGISVMGVCVTAITGQIESQGVSRANFALPTITPP